MVLVIYEDENFIAVDKPAGLLVHKTPNSKELTLVDWLVERYPEIKNVGDDPKLRPGIVHRLDKDTSGILIVARTQRFFSYFKELFQKHEIKKTYLALVHGELKPRQGIIEKAISLKLGTVCRTIYKGKLEKPAVTEYRLLKFFQYNQYNTLSAIADKVLYFSLVELIPKTGRTHQLRVHLASIGHPVAGDRLYGRQENPWNLKRQFLHAQSIEFSLPNRSRIKIEADLPDDLQEIIDSLNKKS
jgi:23S rRNA pseudouridine1911/1915/1917 synthase